LPDGHAVPTASAGIAETGEIIEVKNNRIIKAALNLLYNIPPIDGRGRHE
jgi:hypothetical protein